MISTQSELAQHLGVSTRLVASAFSGNGRIGPVTRERILAKARELGYEPNRAARALVRGKTNLITLALPALSSSFNSRIVRAIEGIARTSTYGLMVTGIKDPGWPAGPPDNVTVTPWPTDGMILAEATFLEPGAWRGGGNFLVFSGGAYRRRVPHDRVEIDLRPGVDEAMQLLTSRAKRIAMLGGTRPEARGEARIEAYLGAMAAAGKAPEFIGRCLGQGDEPRLVAADYLQVYANKHGMPDGLFCWNDEMALGAYRVLRKMGLRVGTDVLVTGCDGGVESLDAFADLTTIYQPVEEACLLAWDFLRERMENPELESRHVVFPSRLVHRESTGAAFMAHAPALVAGFI